MEYLTVILLGALQGVAEFLPISSKGHLVLASELLGFEEADLELIVALHFGTLLSILVVYRRDILPALKNARLVLAVVVATLPLVAIGLFLKDAVEKLFDDPLITGGGLCGTALLMLFARRVEHGDTALEQTSWKQALVVGLFQGAAIFPGISRSGSTLFGGLTAGLNRGAAVNFSFYIAVPAILGAAVLHAKDLLHQGTGEIGLGPVLAGTAVAFVVGVVSLRGLLEIVQRQKLHWFAIYCASVGIAVIVWQLTTRAF